MITTKTKLRIARLLNRMVVPVRGTPHANVTRGGLRWRLDLNEGVDFAIYLGAYQKISKWVARQFIRPGSTVLDIGANIGSHTLRMAQIVGPQGRVIAVEPTEYAYTKLVENVRVNGKLSDRIVAIQAALGDSGQPKDPPKAFYSRWPLADSRADCHRQHGGQFETAGNARFLSLDALIKELRGVGKIAGPISFVKIDVDGHELDVLRGGAQTISAERPLMQIELAPHVQDEVADRFDNLIGTLADYGYRLEACSGAPLPRAASALRARIKFGASMDAIARPA